MMVSMRKALLLAAVGAAALRLWGIDWGLPNTMNADEPHLVNLAVSFGAGSLRPYSLKYPTFWPYALFALYGVYFLSRGGLGRGVAEFASHFAWHPGAFYLLARLLAAAASLFGCWVIYKEEERNDPEALPWAALLLAVSPVIVELAHSAKPDCWMFLWACLGWRYALRLSARRDYWLSGFYFGLAAASQYTAAPAFGALIVAGLLRREPIRVVEGALAAALGVFITAPFVLLDLPRVLAGMRDMQALMALKPYAFSTMAPLVLKNAWYFAGPGVAGFAALMGIVSLLYRDRARALVLASVPLFYIVFLSRHHDGGWARYMLAGFPGLALLAAEGFETIRRRRSSFGATVVLLFGALGPAALADVHMDRRMSLPDTRAAAAEWLRGNVAEGTTLLLDVPHASPDLPMTKEQLNDLAAKTRATGSPRARFYEAMARSHPGGGYKIFRMTRDPAGLSAGPKHVEQSQADYPVLDISSGLAAAIKAGVAYVVTTDFGASAAEAPQFFAELEKQATLKATYAPQEGKADGPILKIYNLKK